MELSEAQVRVLIETLNTATVAIQEIASRLGYEMGGQAERVHRAAATANRELFDAFPQFKAVSAE